MRSVRFIVFPLLLVPMVAGATACAQFALAPDSFYTGAGGSTGGGVMTGYGASLDDTSTGSSTGSSTSTGAGGSSEDPMNPPLVDGSFSYLCGDTSSPCMPGTDDCALGGNPNANGSPADASVLTCQLVAQGTDVRAQCGMSGEGTNASACATVTDCAGGFGCVDVGYSAVGGCRAYCCADLESCPANTYCSPTPIFGASAQPVPVCIPATMCQLLEDAQDCPKGTTCAIVRENGTTSCVTPGTGVAGDACTGSAGPCAAGYTCLGGTCFELCHVHGTECGPGGSCQGGDPQFPSDIGFCVF